MNNWIHEHHVSKSQEPQSNYFNIHKTILYLYSLIKACGGPSPSIFWKKAKKKPHNA